MIIISSMILTHSLSAMEATQKIEIPEKYQKTEKLKHFYMMLQSLSPEKRAEIETFSDDPEIQQVALRTDAKDDMLINELGVDPCQVQ